MLISHPLTILQLPCDFLFLNPWEIYYTLKFKLIRELPCSSKVVAGLRGQ